MDIKASVFADGRNAFVRIEGDESIADRQEEIVDAVGPDAAFQWSEDDRSVPITPSDGGLSQDGLVARIVFPVAEALEGKATIDLVQLTLSGPYHI